MHYTHELPKRVGYYWYKKYPIWQGVIVYIYMDARGELLQDNWSLKYHTNDGKSTWSSEPILEPTEVKDESQRIEVVSGQDERS